MEAEPLPPDFITVSGFRPHGRESMLLNQPSDALA
jgi:hypothetical protein